jgi:hypothetical protein
VKINGKQHYLWRAIDQEGEVVDVFLRASYASRVLLILGETGQAQRFLAAHAAGVNGRSGVF